jgi:hypothetical protein
VFVCAVFGEILIWQGKEFSANMPAVFWRTNSMPALLSGLIGRTIDAMARRLADLESFILSQQVRDRGHGSPQTPVSVPPPISASVTSEPKPSYRSYPPAKPSPPYTAPADDSTDEATSPPGVEHSLIDVNNETHGVEYYGGSSSAAIFDRLYKHARRSSSHHSARPSASQKPSLVNLLHNPEFHEHHSTSAVHDSPDGTFHAGEPVTSSLIEGGFLSAFFTTLHYMHPVIDRNVFIERCDKGGVEQDNSFAALYYACLAVAAITSPEKDPKLAGFSPIKWANMYVDRSKNRISLWLHCLQQIWETSFL